MDWFNSEVGIMVMAIIGGVVTIASAVVKYTPNEVDNKVVDFILNVLNTLGFNNGSRKEVAKGKEAE